MSDCPPLDIRFDGKVENIRRSEVIILEVLEECAEVFTTISEARSSLNCIPFDEPLHPATEQSVSGIESFIHSDCFWNETLAMGIEVNFAYQLYCVHLFIVEMYD